MGRLVQDVIVQVTSQDKKLATVPKKKKKYNLAESDKTSKFYLFLIAVIKNETKRKDCVLFHVRLIVGMFYMKIYQDIINIFVLLQCQCIKTKNH